MDRESGGRSDGHHPGRRQGCLRNLGEGSLEALGLHFWKRGEQREKARRWVRGGALYWGGAEGLGRGWNKGCGQGILITPRLWRIGSFY